MRAAGPAEGHKTEGRVTNAGDERAPTLGGSPAPVKYEPKVDGYGYGMPSCVKNAVRMIQSFYSDTSTVEKSQSFWNASVRASTCLNETARLSVFRECLKGKTGENRWMYSPINEFETLRRGFRNRFIFHTPLQMIERLKNAKRKKGISVEVWADLVLSLCDAAQCTDPQIRYQYFLAGLWSKEWKTALSTSMANTIPQALTVLLYKSMHIPNEDDAEFAGEAMMKPVPENAMVQQMVTMMQQTQNPLVQQQKQLARSPWSSRRVVHAATVHNAYFPNMSVVT
ncbi:hypothetical protein PI124_g18363 [Phytophthora idaei]|nr:hypothetical protein PI125_g19068 [Phytophthora idaei]KAG3141722.1 hypothetical protein PI126_g15363 [Phytophthora idaei]KAG3236630.1 hypothetical protein PI124_g18363 [Phytophthora idaei]